MKRKLTRIEAQLSGQTLLTRLLATAPLFLLALGFMTGILAQHTLSGRFNGINAAVFLWPWSVLLGSCAVAVIVCSVRARGRPQPGVLAGGASLCFLALGAIRLIAFEMPQGHDIRHFVGDARALATVRGRVLTQPHSQRQDWCFARFVFTDPPSLFYLNISAIETEHGWSDTSGTIRVHVAEPTPNLQVGSTIQMYCWLYRLAAPTNPGQFDLAGHLARRRVYLGASVPTRAGITVLDQDAPSALDRVRNRLCEAAGQALLGERATDGAAEGLLEALLLGSRQNIDRQTYEAFRRTGLLHMISLSGLHLGILVGLVWTLCKAAGLLKPWRALVCIAATVVFLMVVPPRAPTIRAAVIVWTFCLAILLRRCANPLNTLCLAAIILLMLRPTQLFEPGWQLSFACVAGILALTDPLEDFIRDRTDRWLRREKGYPTLLVKTVARVGVWAMRLFAMGIAAWLGGAGLLLYHFYTITPLTSLWTVLVFPLVTLILICGFLKIILFFLLPTLSHLLGYLTIAGANLLIRIVKILAIPDSNCILIGHVTLCVILLYYGLLLVARFLPTRRPALTHAICIATSLALAGYLGALKWQRTHRDHLCMTCLDVGHGQAIVVQLPGTKTLLFDAGSMHRRDIGARVVVPFLDYLGLDRLHAIAISHNDIDHINGIPEIVQRRRVDHIYASQASFSQANANSPPGVLAAYLEQRGHTIEQVPRLLQDAGATVETLWPLDESPEPVNLSDNDRSLVSKIQFAEASILLCSDIEELAQGQIIALYPGLTAEVVVAPHHGSTTTRSASFLPGLRPRVVLISGASRRGQTQVLISEGPEPAYFLTAQNGAISVCVENNGMVETVSYVRGSTGE